jgi:hypothetical protein
VIVAEAKCCRVDERAMSGNLEKQIKEENWRKLTQPLFRVAEKG